MAAQDMKKLRARLCLACVHACMCVLTNIFRRGRRPILNYPEGLVKIRGHLGGASDLVRGEGLLDFTGVTLLSSCGGSLRSPRVLLEDVVWGDIILTKIFSIY